MTEVIAEAAPEAVPAILSDRALPLMSRGDCRPPLRWRQRTKHWQAHWCRHWDRQPSALSHHGCPRRRDRRCGENVLAIAAGIVEGRQTRGVGTGRLDHARLQRARAARAGLRRARGTLAGLSGLGDLILSCSSLQSRNFALGIALGRGEPARRASSPKARSPHGADRTGGFAKCRYAVSNAVAAILAGKVTIDAAIEGLLTRPFRAEE